MTRSTSDYTQLRGYLPQLIQLRNITRDGDAIAPLHRHALIVCGYAEITSDGHTIASPEGMRVLENLGIARMIDEITDADVAALREMAGRGGRPAREAVNRIFRLLGVAKIEEGR